MTSAPSTWIKEIHQALLDAQLIPLAGHTPSFDWDAFSQKISSLLESEWQMTERKRQTLSSSDLASGFGAGFVLVALDMTPLKSQAFWLMGREEVAKLTALALRPSNGNKGFTSPKFQEGFYYFLATKALSAIDEMKAFGDLSPKLAASSPLPEAEALCIDVELKSPKQTLWGRLICPHAFYEEFKTHFSTKEPEALTSSLAREIDVPLKVELGQTSVSPSSWEKIKVGDFLLLDRCTYDPQTHKGTVMLTLHNTPLLRARIKENSLKIVDYASYHEEQISEEPEETFGETEQAAGEENHLWAPPAEEKTEEKAPHESPMALTVEAARLRINLDKLLHLAPDSVLELPVRPDQGVDLIAHGKKVAHGELIKLGEMLGVKILQVGS